MNQAFAPLVQEPMNRHIRRRETCRAVELSGRVCPGARRHPYAACRKLGGLGADYLTAVAKELCGPNAGQMLLEAFPLDTEGFPEFNVGLMV